MGKYIMLNGANFAPNRVTTVEIGVDRTIINANTDPENAGTVTGGGAYTEGTSVQLIATAAKGYTFVRWSDGVTTPTRTITVGSSNAIYTAIFEKAPVVLKWALGLEEGGYQPMANGITVNNYAYTPNENILQTIESKIGNHKIKAIKIYVKKGGKISIIKTDKLVFESSVWALKGVNVDDIQTVDIKELGWVRIDLKDEIDFSQNQIVVASTSSNADQNGSYATFDVPDYNGTYKLIYYEAFKAYNSFGVSDYIQEGFTLGIDYGYEE